MYLLERRTQQLREESRGDSAVNARRMSNTEQTNRYLALTLYAGSGDSEMHIYNHDASSIFCPDLERSMKYKWQEAVLDALIEQSLARTRAAAEIIEARIAVSPKIGVEYAALLDAAHVLNVVRQRHEAANLHSVQST